MLLNGHIISMRRHMGLGANNPVSFIAYIEKFDERVRNKAYIRAVAAFGSLTRGSYGPTSDIDVRIVPLEDHISFFRACMFAMTERTRAVLSGFPLDLYVFDIGTLQKKMRLDEIPMVLCDPHGLIEQTYQKVISSSQFITSFKVKYV
jgi:predicted nucleotidyltransferase